MVLKLYNNNSERNCINKVLLNESVYNGTLRETTSIKAPVLKIVGNESILNYNYCYIVEFGRYYYITDVRSIRSNLWELSLLCDVLMSFKTDILNSYGVISDTKSKEVSMYLESDIWKTLCKDKTDIINFSGGSSFLTNGQYILITAGG